MRTLMQRTKTAFFHHISTQQVFFESEFMIEEVEFVVAQDYKFENGAKWKKYHFLENSTVKTLMQRT